ncbi:MAG: hypothetical protein J0I82_11725, partial [Spirosoma sp.]
MNKVEIIVNIALTEEYDKPATIDLINKYKANCIELANAVIDDLDNHEELDPSIKKIIITDNYETAVQEQANLWNLRTY